MLFHPFLLYGYFLIFALKFKMQFLEEMKKSFSEVMTDSVALLLTWTVL